MFERIIIIGNLGKDPSVRLNKAGRPVVTLNVATNRKYVDDNTNTTHKETTWFIVTVGGSQAEFVSQYCKKGSQVLIDGKLRPDRETGGPRIWTRNDGAPAANFEIIADVVRLLGKKGDNEGDETDDDFLANIVF